MTRLLLATGAVDDPTPVRAAVSMFRRGPVADYLARIDRAAAAAALAEVARWRLADATMSPAEAAQVRALARRGAPAR
jgi:hypothetical protein